MRRLSINGTFADLSNDTIGLTWQFLDITEPDKLMSPYSSSITLPFTSKNNAIFGYANTVGSRLTLVRGTYDCNYYFGPYKIISNGTLKVNEITDKGFKVSLSARTTLIDTLNAAMMPDVLDGAAVTTGVIASSYADAIDSLVLGSDGWILPFVKETADSSILGVSDWNIYDYDLPGQAFHELWVSLAILIDSIETVHSVIIKVAEGGTIKDVQGSDLYAYLEKYYTPAWNYIIHPDSYPTDWRPAKVLSGSRVYDDGEIDYTTFVFFGGQSVWEFIKTVAQITGSILYVDGATITLAPLLQMDTFPVHDWSNKTAGKTKYPYIKNFVSDNKIRFKVSDNTLEDFGEVTLPMESIPEQTKAILTVPVLLPGHETNSFMPTVWLVDYKLNTELAKAPVVLFDEGLVSYEINVNWHPTGAGSQTALASLRHLSYINLLTHYLPFYVMADKGLSYEADLMLNFYDFINLKPYSLVKINELGGVFYVNEIKNFDPESGKSAKCQLIKFNYIDKALNLTNLAALFVTDNAAAYLAVGPTLTSATNNLYFQSSGGIGLTGISSTNTIAENIKGVITTTQAFVAARKRRDRITMSGTSGDGEITCNGVTRAITYASDINTTCANFVTNHAAAYLAAGVVVTASGNILYFEAVTAGVNFTGLTGYIQFNPTLSAVIVTLVTNAVYVPQIDRITLSGNTGWMYITVSGVTKRIGMTI